ncbi:TIGR01777 family oxidoreductase [Hymenobacter sp. UV11]|uniref:TIGR01777 family oxidoreductase n=1 Tax=Hymenobacter sp. UV11 TaxID=1849735 RepID=UPI0010DCCD03|nr:TIGR01777 family oxidoreductase [Hymenobacter sp. UV11]TDN36814.1 TIGR01777 family protein [Hymenobacter sp. UV11]
MNILLTGGTGLIGTRLSAVLAEAGHHVAHVSRTLAPGSSCRTFQWDPAAGTIDPAAVPFAEAVVNLAGANVGEGQWTTARKQELLASRVDGLALLHRELAKPGHRVRTVVSASAIGLYGTTGDALVTEDTPPVGHDLLADLTQAWEQAAAPLAALGLRVVVPRIGVVLSLAGGALPALAGPVQRGFGAPLGSGQQWLSWIHMDDLCRLLLAMLTDDAWQGAYNAVAPSPATNTTFTTALAEVLHCPLLLPKIPAFMLQLAMGEQSELVLTGKRVSAAKVLAQGFAFEFPGLREALQALYPPAPQPAPSGGCRKRAVMNSRRQCFKLPYPDRCRTSDTLF